MKLHILLACCVLFVSFANADVNLNKVGQSTMNFQLVSLSARAGGLGDAVFASSVGSEAIFYNPAGLALTPNRYDVSFMQTGWIADINYLAGSFALNLEDFGCLGFSALWVDYGTIYATRLIPKGMESLYPLGYEDLGEMNNVGAYSLGVSYARAVNNQFSVGGTMRYTTQKLGESLLADGVKKNDASKLVFDMGVLYNTGYKDFRFGMAIRNFSSNITREEIEEQLPLTFTLGTAVNLLDILTPEHDRENKLTLSADYLHFNNYSERANFGIEYLFRGMFALRGGYQTNRDLASWSGGVGVKTNIDKYNVRVDYSYSAQKYFSGVNRIQVGFNF